MQATTSRTCGAPSPSSTAATQPPALVPSSMSGCHAAAAATAPGKRSASLPSTTQRSCNGAAAAAATAAFPMSSRCSSSFGDTADTPPLRQSTQPRTTSPSPPRVVDDSSATPSPGQTPVSATAEPAIGIPPLTAATPLPSLVCGASAVPWGSRSGGGGGAADGTHALLGSDKGGKRLHKAGSVPHSHRRGMAAGAAAAESRSTAERCKAARTLAAELMSALMERPPAATRIAQYRAAMKAATEPPPANGSTAASEAAAPHNHRHAHHADASAVTASTAASRPAPTTATSHTFLEAVLHGRSRTPVGSSPSTPLMHLRAPSAPPAAPASGTPAPEGGTASTSASASASASVPAPSVPPAGEVPPGRRPLELVPGDTAIIPQLLSVLREIALSCASLDMLGRVSASTSSSTSAAAATAATHTHAHAHAGKVVGGASAPVTAAVVGRGSAVNGGRTSTTTTAAAVTATSELGAEEEAHWNRVRAHFEVVRGMILNEHELASVLDDALGAEWRATGDEEQGGAAATAAVETAAGGVSGTGATVPVVVPVMPTPVDGETPPTSSRLASRGFDPASRSASPPVPSATGKSPRGTGAAGTTATTTSSHTATNATGTAVSASSPPPAATNTVATTTTATTLNHNAPPFHSRTPPTVQQQQQQRRGLGVAPTSSSSSPPAPSPVAHRRASSNAAAQATTTNAILCGTSTATTRGSAGSVSVKSASDTNAGYVPVTFFPAGQDRGSTTAPSTSTTAAAAAATNTNSGTSPPPRMQDDGGGDGAGMLNFPSTPLSEAAVPYQPSVSVMGTSPRSGGGGGMSASSTTPFHLESREEMLRRRSAAPNAFYASMSHGGATHFLGGPPSAATTPGTFGPSSMNGGVPPFSLNGGSGARSLPVSPIVSYSSPLGASPCPYEYLLVLDFEATCEEHPPPNYLYEIIEFPVVVVDVRLQRVVAEFHRFVRPRYKRELSAFCKELTGMRQADVDAAAPLEEVLLQFERWYANTLPLHARCVFATDGPMDLREFMYHHSVSRQGIRFPPLFYQFIDVKHTFACFFQCSQGKIKAMLEVLHLPFEGRLHSGLDDARNIASIVIGLLHYGCSFCEVPLNRLPLNGLLLGGPNPAGASLPLSLPPSMAVHGVGRVRMTGVSASSPAGISAPYSVDEEDCSF